MGEKELFIGEHSSNFKHNISHRIKTESLATSITINRQKIKTTQMSFKKERLRPTKERLITKYHLDKFEGEKLQEQLERVKRLERRELDRGYREG